MWFFVLKANAGEQRPALLKSDCSVVEGHGFTIVIL